MPATFRYIQRDDRPNKRGECPIYLRITCHRKKKYYNTGFRILPKHWDSDKERVRRSHRTYRKLNDELDILLNTAKDGARVLRREGQESAEGITQRIIGASKDNFFALAKDHIAYLEQNDQFYTKKNTKATIKKLTEFNGSKSLLFTEINSRYLERFQEWLQSKKGNKGSTIRKNMSDIKRILKVARKKHLLFKDPFENVEPVSRGRTAYKPKLSYEKITAIKNLKLPTGTILEQARDAFLFSFYANGMRFGDLCMLRWKNVEEGSIAYQMGKTGTNINISISEGAQAILDRYSRKDADREEFIFPFLRGYEKATPNQQRQRISSQNAYVNESLDTIAEKANIKDNISMHVARHSFAQFAVDKGARVYDVMQHLGHQSVQTTEEYLQSINVKAKKGALDDIYQ